MRKREKDRIVAKAVHDERERIAKILCPLCRFGADLSDDMHPLKLEANETTGTWVKCLADRIRKNAAPQVPGSSASTGAAERVQSPNTTGEPLSQTTPIATPADAALTLRDGRCE